MKNLKEFLIDIDWIICQVVAVTFLMLGWTIPGCTLMFVSVYFSEKDRRNGKF